MGSRLSKNKASKVDISVLREKKVVFIIGGPGSGKGTQCSKIVEKFGYTHLSTGDLLRAEVHSGSDRGKQLKDTMDQGKLVPMEPVLQLLKEAMIASADKSKGYILDGYPRRLYQATTFEKEIRCCEFVLFFDVSDETMTTRILDRAKTSGRTDDNEETIKTRLSAFHEGTTPVIEYFEKEGKVKTISAESDVDTIFIEVEKIFDALTLEEMPPATSLSETKVVFIIGGPGSGKGTQCSKIVEKYGFCHLSSGDLLRADVKSGSERGKSINETIEKGQLVSLEVVLTLLKEAIQIKKIESDTKCFLIDGYPREMEQGKRFEAEIAVCTSVLYFDVSNDVMMTRLLERAKTSGRVDDNEETIKKRIATFHEQTKAVVDHYTQQDKVVQINAEGNVDEVFAQVQKYMETQAW